MDFLNETLRVPAASNGKMEEVGSHGRDARWRFPVPPSDRGVDLKRLAPGTVVEARTRNSTYLVQVGADGAMRISGHAEHCPRPVPAISVGSVLVTGSVYDRYLAEGLRIEFRIRERRVFTSRIMSLRIVPD